MTRTILALLVFSAPAIGLAEPPSKAAAPKAEKPKPASVVEKVDPLVAAKVRNLLLEAKLAELEWTIKRIAFEQEAKAIALRYKLDVSAGDGWDEETLIIRRKKDKEKEKK